MQFTITFTFDGRKYNVAVEQTLLTETREQYTIIGNKETLVFESNRPLFRNRGLKKRVPDWKLVSGNLWNMHLREVLSKAIMNYLEPPLK